MLAKGIILIFWPQYVLESPACSGVCNSTMCLPKEVLHTQIQSNTTLSVGLHVMAVRRQHAFDKPHMACSKIVLPEL